MNDNMLKVLSESALAMFGIANLSAPLLAQAGGGVEEWIAKLGALGLCGFMVLQNYRQSEAMGKIIREKDAQLIDLTKQYLAAEQRHSDAINGLSSALRGRPCIMGDRRFDEQAPDAK